MIMQSAMDNVIKYSYYIDKLRRSLGKKLRRKQERRDEQNRRKRSASGQVSFHEFVMDLTTKFLTFIQSVVLWEHPINSISVLTAFNMIFWVTIVLEVRGLMAVCSTALVIALCYSTMVILDDAVLPSFSRSLSKTEQMNKLVDILKSTVKNIVRMQQEQPRAFCTAMCTISFGIWILSRNIDSIFIIYTLCMSILLGPAVLLLHKEWDSEIEEFLPVASEDNLQILKRAGDIGDRSPTPSRFNSSDTDDENEMIDSQILEEELGLSSDTSETDGIRFRAVHFERKLSTSSSASSENLSKSDQLDYAPTDSSDNESEFEIIDVREIDHLKNA